MVVCISFYVMRSQYMYRTDVVTAGLSRRPAGPGDSVNARVRYSAASGFAPCPLTFSHPAVYPERSFCRPPPAAFLLPPDYRLTTRISPAPPTRTFSTSVRLPLATPAHSAALNSTPGTRPHVSVG